MNRREAMSSLLGGLGTRLYLSQQKPPTLMQRLLALRRYEPNLMDTQTEFENPQPVMQESPVAGRWVNREDMIDAVNAK